MKKFLFLLLTLFIILSAKNANAGTTYTWTGLGFNGNWTTSANWFPSSGYPGKTSTTDIAVINTYGATVALSSSLTISQLSSTLYTTAAVTIQFSGSPTLTITNGISTAQPLLASVGFTFAGSGTASISGTSSFAYLSSLAVSSGATVTFAASATVDFTANQGGLINAGTVNFSSGSTCLMGFNAYINNSGTINTTGTTFTMSGSPCSIANTGTFNAATSTFTLTGSNIPITNSGSGAFTTTNCSFTSNNSGCTITNSATFTDHGSTFSFTGQSNTITNSGSSSTFRVSGTTISFSGTNNGHKISNAGFFIFDTSSAVNLGTFNSQISNTGTVYAGTSNSPCIINLTGQGSNINNTGTFYVGSTSGITMSGYQSAIATGSSAFFIFQSDAFGSGYLGSVPANSVNLITGTYYIQRYIQGGSPTYRAYRLFSSPVYASTVSSNNVYSLNYVQASALVTGTTGTGGGFDKTGNPSLYLYRENVAFSNSTFISGNFRGVSSLTSAPTYTINGDAGNYNIPAGNGFLFFFRGDRTTNLANKYKPGTTAESVTMTAVGTMNVGQVIVHDWYTPASPNLGYTATAGNAPVTGVNIPGNVKGCNLVGNPYPSSIDWETFQTSSATTGIYGNNVSTTIYTLDLISHNYGAYTKGGGGVGTNNATNIIASGQGFFVTATGNTPALPQLIFNETAKTSAQVTGNKLLMGMPATQAASMQYLRLQLSMDSVDTDETLIRFNSNAGMAYTETADALYKPGFGKVSLASISSDKMALAINTIPLPKTTETTGLVLSAKTDGVYTLTMKEINQVPQLFDIWLMDAYNKDSVDMRQNPAYNFMIYQADSASFGAKRFTLVIRQNPAYAYRLLSFDAKRAANPSQVSVNWTTENEQNYTYFTVERSNDGGKTYNIIGNVPASGQGSYGFTDKSPADGVNYYRLKQQDINDSITYSNVVEVQYSPLASGISSNLSVYPNPAISTITLALNNIVNSIGPADNYNVMITNSSGLLVRQSSFSQPTWQTNVSSLLPGAYIIKVFSNKTQAEIGETKFIKL